MIWTISHYDSVSSTQDMARANLRDHHVIVADQQIQGRGRFGNQWESPVGNIYMSIVLKPDCVPQHGGKIAFVIAVSLCETLRNYHSDIHIKWPNDILQAGKKLSGTLIEKEGDFYIVGIGVNIKDAPPNAACLSDAPDNNEIIQSFLNVLETHYTSWLKDGFDPVRTKWLAMAIGMNKPITARLPNQSIQGIFRDLDNDGALLLEENGTNKMHKISAGAIQLGHDTE